MIRHRSAGGAAVLLTALASSLPAQRSRTLEVGAFAQAAYFDESLGFDQASGGGGARLGFFLVPALSVEVEGAFIPTDLGLDRDLEYIPLRGSLLLNLRAGEHVGLLLGGGYVHNEYRGEVDGSDDGASAQVGLRLGLPGLPSARVGTYLDYIPSPVNGASENWNWGIQAGLSFMVGAGRGEPRAREPEADSVALALQRDSLARAQADSARAVALRDSLARAKRDSIAREQERRQSRAQALRDSLELAAREDSLRAVALRDSLRLTRNQARMAALRDSLELIGQRDSLRALLATGDSRMRLRVANFELNEATLLPIARDLLQDVARSLVANPQVMVEVAGHTDTTGPREFNERLSRDRAEVVKVFLIENGVTAERMTTQGYAWDQPVASNSTASGRAQNRRTELRRTE